MKFLWLLIVAVVLVAAEVEKTSDPPQNEAEDADALQDTEDTEALQEETEALETLQEETKGSETLQNTNAPTEEIVDTGVPQVEHQIPVTIAAAGNTVEGRSRSIPNSNTRIRGNQRFLGLGGIPGNFGPSPVEGFGVNPAFGGGFGVNPAFGGGIGGNLALGGGLGVNPAFGGIIGINPTFGGVNPPSSCRYWCRTPQSQVYCCEDASQPQSFVGVKPGFCPPVRPVCPSVRHFNAPSTCSSDGSCAGFDKCCFDTCLEEHVCKPPSEFRR